MRKYRNIYYNVWNTNFIKLFNPEGVRREGKVMYTNGEAYVTIPEDLRHAPEVFARHTIDRLYKSMEYHKNYEIRDRLK